ncbi:DUF5983 family protein [Vibrio agarivorans]|uniref:DUF5983 family protein n=1 Tax=Vibrio agarivorans TaxID=153622 RepID=UPI0025B50C34|nr:hypothetical protein [Vibrio agarivorans]MDN3661125.1 hypothetical protein [Vibrio agarivorans]
MKFNETYKTACVSTQHMQLNDVRELKVMCDEQMAMVAERETGFFLKLFEDVSENHYPKLSTELSALIKEAAEQGFRCIEFDCDAESVDGAKEFDW